MLLESNKAKQYKNDIIGNHAESRYAQILKNPQQVLDSDENSPEKLYANTFRKFVNQDYEAALTDAEKYISQFTGEEIVPKFEMLKAITLARLDGLPAYKEALNYVALNYPNNEEGKRAQEILNGSLLRMEKRKWTNDDKATKFKLVYIFNKDDKNQSEALLKKINKALVDLRYDAVLSVSDDVYNRNERFVVIHGFKSKLTALGFEEILRTNPKYGILKDYILISSENYETAQIHKNLMENN